MRRSPGLIRNLIQLGALAVLWAAIPSAFAADVEGPFVSNIAQDSVVIWWESLGADPAPGQVVIDGRRIGDDAPPYEALVDGLEPGRPYTYFVEFEDGDRRPAEGVYTFRTAPPRGSDKPFRFAVMCDSRGSNPSDPVSAEVLETLLRDANSQRAELVLFPGDLIFGYCKDEAAYREQLKLWKATAAGIMAEVPVYVTMGNHDVVLHRVSDGFGKYDLDGVMRDGVVITGEEMFADEFVNPRNGPAAPEAPGAPPYAETCYSVDYGSAHFVMLNTNYWVGTRTYPHEPGDPCRLYAKGNPEGRIMDRQLAWLRADLTRARRSGAKHIFVLGHEPAFPAGKHADDAMHYEGNATLSLKRDIRARRERFWKMLGEFNVLAAFFGDEHNYSRALIGPAGDIDYEPPIWHIITGGAGADPSDKLRMDLPWADSIRVFEDRRHYCLVTIEGAKASLEVYAIKTDEDAKKPVHHASGGVEFFVIDRVANLTLRD